MAVDLSSFLVFRPRHVARTWCARNSFGYRGQGTMESRRFFYMMMCTLSLLFRQAWPAAMYSLLQLFWYVQVVQRKTNLEPKRSCRPSSQPLLCAHLQRTHLQSMKFSQVNSNSFWIFTERYVLECMYVYDACVRVYAGIYLLDYVCDWVTRVPRIWTSHVAHRYCWTSLYARSSGKCITRVRARQHREYPHQEHNTEQNRDAGPITPTYTNNSQQRA